LTDDGQPTTVILMSEMQTHAVVPELTLGWRLRLAVAHAGISVEEIADEMGVSRSTVSRWANDRGPVREIYLKQWALRCGVPYEWLNAGAASDPTGSSTTRQYLADNAADLIAA
jgi:transcriptional regulator with XRE-family HTH domain